MCEGSLRWRTFWKTSSARRSWTNTMSRRNRLDRVLRQLVSHGLQGRQRYPGFLLNKDVVGVMGGDREHAHLRFGERRDEGRQHARFSEGKRPVQAQAEPIAVGAHTRGHGVRGADDGKL